MPRKSSKTRTRTKAPTRGDVITVDYVGSGSSVAIGRGAKASIDIHDSLIAPSEWVRQINAKIDASLGLSQSEKSELKTQTQKIDEEIKKGTKADLGRLERWINTVAVMAPDIFDVVVATLQSPLAGIGMVIKKIGDRAKLESSPS